jgi:glycosyltransferase involved in cell wall biosynthesis
VANQSQPLISIIMPAYNAGRFIQAAIDSVLDQTYPHWQLIVVDDQSTDNTVDMVQSYADPRIIYHKVPKVGKPAGVRNAGMRMATGDFIAFLDADDLFYPSALADLLAPFQEKPARQAVYGFAFHIDESGQPNGKGWELTPLANNTYGLPVGYETGWERLIRGHISCMLPALMLRREFLERVGYFNETLFGAEDYEFYVRMYLADYDNIHCVPSYIYQYRCYTNSTTKDEGIYQQMVNNDVKIADWLMSLHQIPVNLKAMESVIYTEVYRDRARSWLMAHRPDLTRKIALQALGNSHIQFKDWVKLCLPLWVRSFIPEDLQMRLIQFRRKLKQKQQYQHDQQYKVAISS